MHFLFLPNQSENNNNLIINRYGEKISLLSRGRSQGPKTRKKKKSNSFLRQPRTSLIQTSSPKQNIFYQIQKQSLILLVSFIIYTYSANNAVYVLCSWCFLLSVFFKFRIQILQIFFYLDRCCQLLNMKKFLSFEVSHSHYRFCFLWAQFFNTVYT